MDLNLFKCELILLIQQNNSIYWSYHNSVSQKIFNAIIDSKLELIEYIQLDSFSYHNSNRLYLNDLDFRT